jgi:hypothetical protein
MQPIYLIWVNHQTQGVAGWAKQDPSQLSRLRDACLSFPLSCKRNSGTHQERDKGVAVNLKSPIANRANKSGLV